MKSLSGIFLVLTSFFCQISFAFIQSLPIEMVWKIGDELMTIDLFHLSLTCKSVNMYIAPILNNLNVNPIEINDVKINVYRQQDLKLVVSMLEQFPIYLNSFNYIDQLLDWKLEIPECGVFIRGDKGESYCMDECDYDDADCINVYRWLSETRYKMVES